MSDFFRMSSHTIMMEPVKKFCRGNLKIGVDSRDNSGTETGNLSLA